MITLHDLPEGSGRRFLFGLFGKDHDIDDCEKDGCGDCSIIAHYDHDVGRLRAEVERLKEQGRASCNLFDDLKKSDAEVRRLELQNGVLEDALLSLLKFATKPQPRDEEEQEQVVAKVAAALRQSGRLAEDEVTEKQKE